MAEQSAIGTDAPSPLTEADTSSLDELFSRKPPFDEGALTRIVAEFRRKRESWETLGEGEKVTKKRASKASATAAPVQLSADDFWSE